MPPVRRFFCGPHAKKSVALAKQQKKRARADGVRAATEVDSEADDSSGGSDTDEEQAPKKRRKGFARADKVPAMRSKARRKAGIRQVAGRGKATGICKATKVVPTGAVTLLPLPDMLHSMPCAAMQGKVHHVFWVSRSFLLHSR